MLRDLHWTGIVFGTGAGLVVGLVLFSVLGAIGGNTVVQILVQVIAFGVAGAVAGRLSLLHGAVAGRISALLLFFVIAASTIAAGAGANPFGLIFLGVLALGSGSAGARLAEKARRT